MDVVRVVGRTRVFRSDGDDDAGHRQESEHQVRRETHAAVWLTDGEEANWCMLQTDVAYEELTHHPS